MMNDLNATQLAGIFVFMLPAVFFILRKRQKDSQLFFLGFFYLFLVAEVIMGNRHLLSETLSSFSADSWLYNNRRGIVAVIIISALALFAATTLYYIAKLRSHPVNRISLMIACLTLALFILETASIHQIDAIFYKPMGPILLIGWLWLLLGSAATLTAFASRNLKVSSI